ncbi:hypothetical protein ACFV9E_40575 [Streptomyces sp. NPDC059835]|uniref:hypothetical protein n=1 Tax=Streptomyces sp. NPDC059835 TaxID=3346967 RepID=UPI00364638EE
MAYISGSSTALTGSCRTFDWGARSVGITCYLYRNGATVERSTTSGKGGASSPTFYVPCPVPGRWEVAAYGPDGQSDHKYLTV